MAGRPLATAFVRIRPDLSTFKSEATTQMQTVSGGSGAAAKEGEKAGKSFGSKMSAGLAKFSGVISKAGAIGLGALIFEIGKQGNELEDSQARLDQAIKKTGSSADAVAPQLDKVRAKMEKWGFTNAQVNTSLGTLTTATGSVQGALKSEATAADLAAFKHIDLGSASDILSKAYAGATKAIKGLNLTLATGSTSAKALAKAQLDLGDQIDAAGGIAGFAREHHLKLAEAQKLVHEAADRAGEAEQILASKGLTLNTVTKLVMESMGGSAKATKELAAHNLTLHAAQGLVKQSAEGSIPAFNKLGFVVLPATATAAERMAQVQAALNSRLGGQAAAAAATAGGSFAAMKAQLVDVGAKIGAKVLPYLAKILEWANKSGILIPIVIAVIVAMTVAMGAAAIAALAFSTALTGGIALAVVGLIAGIVLLIKHWDDVKAAFDSLWKWVQEHKIFALLLGPIGLMVIAIITLAQHWRGLVTVVIKGAQDIGKTGGLIGAWVNNVLHWFHTVQHDGSAAWDLLWNNTVGRTQKGVANVNALIVGLRHLISNDYDGLRHDVAAAWNTIWANTVSRVAQGIATVVGWFRGLPGKVVNALTGLGHTLGSFAAAALNEMWDGFKRVGGGIIGWMANFAKNIIGVVKNVLKVFSPSAVFHDIGMSLMEGLKNGVEAGVHKAQKAAAIAAQKVANVGSGVARWTGTVQQALRMEGLSLGLTSQVLRQISSESGGNPNAINNTDINAQHGDPSRGLLQTIGATFQAYHWPGTSNNIYDPLANIAAAINYARHVYGPNLMSGGMGLGSGHGYAQGTMSARRGWAWVGELGKELVNFRGGEQVVPHAKAVPVGRTRAPAAAPVAAVDTSGIESILMAIHAALAAQPGANGAAVAAALNGVAHRAGNRAFYGVT